SKEREIENLPIPEVVSIPLSQHIGAPAEVVVKSGDTVKVGDLIAKAAGFVSSNIHSSVSGTVKSIDLMPNASGIKQSVVTINVAGDEWNDKIDRSTTLVKECKLSGPEIIQKISDAEIVGLGGATFPTQVKLMVPKGKKAECLIINAVECEPFLTADHRLMLEKGEEIIAGINIVCKALGVERAYIGIENNKPDAIAHLTKLTADQSNITVVPLLIQYPQGGEKQLIDAVIGRQVPSGALPIEVGAVVQNVGTIFAIYEAVQKNKPLFERIVTVTGNSLSQPKNLLVRVGIPIATLIEYAGGVPNDTVKIIGGGPMMGRAICNVTAPVIKGSSGILLMNAKETQRKTESPCISCAKCISVCPMGLEPYLINRMSRRNMFAELEQHSVTDCIECGSCSFTCPANIPLLDNILLAKGEVMKLIRSR
ncbi:MAG: electron transport complex subunit RsxC, partial [Rikenellaceae bacterium]